LEIAFGSDQSYGRTAMSVNTLLKEKRKEIFRIASKYGAHHVRVFGSVARGESGRGSDLDLLVRFDRGVTLLNQAALIRELEPLLGSKVDVVSDKGLRPRVRKRVLAEAKPL
jgi:predicted nucleotidyltransferase